MKTLFPLLCIATAFGLASCDSKSDTANNASTPGAASDAAAGGSTGDGAGSVERKPSKSGPRPETTKPETHATASGLKYTVLKKGAGTVHPKATDTVSVHYHGTLLNGTVFDSSVDRGEPASFPLNGVIPGWTEGVQLMVAGDKFKFEIPSDLAYGPSGRPPVIPPDSTLVFEVELLEIK